MNIRHTLAAAALAASATALTAQEMPAQTAPTSPATSAPATAATASATAADVKAGAPVVDSTGAAVGTIESADGTNAVLSTGKVRVQLAVTSFAKNDHALVIGMTKAQVEAEAAKAGGTGD